MTRPDPLSTAHAGAAMALTAIVCVQVGVAASVGLFDDVGPEGAAALRLGWGGVILPALLRPRPSRLRRPALACARGRPAPAAGPWPRPARSAGCPQR